MTREEILNTSHLGELDYLIAKYITKLPKEQIEYGDVPRYSTETVAYSVLAELRSLGWDWSLNLTTDRKIKPFDCRLNKKNCKSQIVYGKSFPEAICKAALLAVLEL